MVEPISLEIEASAEAGGITPLERLRQRVARWAVFALILVFFIVTIASWGYAAWWIGMGLIDLVA